MKGLFFIILYAVSWGQIFERIKANVQGLNTLKGNFMLRVFLPDTVFEKQAQFYLKKGTVPESTKVKVTGEAGSAILGMNSMKIRGVYGTKEFPGGIISYFDELFENGEVSILGQNGNQVEIEYVPADTNSHFLKIKAGIDIEKGIFLWNNIFTEQGVIYTNFDYEKIKGKWILKKMTTLTMNNLKTEIIYENLKVNEEIPDSIFK